MVYIHPSTPSAPVLRCPKKCPKAIGTFFGTSSEDSGTLGLLQLQVRNERMDLIPHSNNVLDY